MANFEFGILLDATRSAASLLEDCAAHEPAYCQARPRHPCHALVLSRGPGTLGPTVGRRIRANPLAPGRPLRDQRRSVASAAVQLRQHLRQGRFGFHAVRSEEHTSELQSRPHLVCRLLLEKKKKK